MKIAQASPGAHKFADGSLPRLAFLIFRLQSFLRLTSPVATRIARSLPKLRHYCSLACSFDLCALHWERSKKKEERK